MTNVPMLRATVYKLLKHPFTDNDWSVQGFGMLRTYLDPDKRFRLNIWDSALAVPNVSVIHDHPWHFTSVIINGRFSNFRYKSPRDPLEGKEYEWAVIKTGPGGGPDGERGRCVMLASPAEVYRTGDVYYQGAQEIHESRFEDGCITLNDRLRLPDGEHARVFWPAGQQWVDAEPRGATDQEVISTLTLALGKWE